MKPAQPKLNRREKTCFSILLSYLQAPVKYSKFLLTTYLILQNSPTVEAKSSEFCPGFTTHAGDPKTANWWLLGEFHQDEHSPKKLACIEKITKQYSEHTILLESIPANLEVSCSIVNIPEKPGRKCIGFDSQNRVDLANKIKTDMLYASKIDQFFKIYQKHKDISDQQFDILVRGQLTKFVKQKQDLILEHPDLKKIIGIQMKNYTDAEFKLRHILLAEKACRDLLSEREQNRSYKKIFAELHTSVTSKAELYSETGFSIKAKDFENHVSIMSESNSSLGKVLNKYHGRKVVAVTGKDHLVVNPKDSARETEATITLNKQLKENQTKDPYVIMAM